MIERLCKNCCYCDSDSFGNDVCKCNPPVVTGEGDSFPVVDKDNDFCSKFDYSGHSMVFDFSCESCRFFDQAFDEKGELLDYGKCRRRAPVSGKEKFPIVMKNDSCGEFSVY